jgi:hypothetical protein
VRLELGAGVKRPDALEGILDAVADRVMARLSEEPFWKALHALAARHPKELVSLAREEEARQTAAEASQLRAPHLRVALLGKARGQA